MKDYLQDIIAHTGPVAGIDLIKVIGSATETTVNAVADDKSVIMTGTFKTAHPDFEGTFGMPNLDKLKTILGFDDYDTDAKITVTKINRDGADVPSAIHFETKNGDFSNDYRLMTKSVVEEKVKNAKLAITPTWAVSFTPSVASIQRLKKQAQANSEEKNFTTETVNGELKVKFGDHSTHSGSFVFEASPGGKLARPLAWPVEQVLTILAMTGDKTFKISDQGLAEITVENGISTYSYLFPAQSK